MASNADYLAKVPLFSGLSRASLLDLAERSVRKKLDKGEVLFLEGEPGHALYIIVGGKVRVEGMGPKGETQVLGMAGVGEVIGEMSLIDGGGRSARVIAHVPCRLLVLYQAEFEQFILKEPSASFVIMRSLCSRVRAADRSLVDLRGQDVRGRILDLLQREADDSGLVRLEMTQTMLSELIGCSREMANKAIRRLEKEGTIERVARGAWRFAGNV